MNNKLIGKILLISGVAWFVISFCGLVFVSLQLTDASWDQITAAAIALPMLVTGPTFILVGIGAVILRPEMWIIYH